MPRVKTLHFCFSNLICLNEAIKKAPQCRAFLQVIDALGLFSNVRRCCIEHAVTLFTNFAE